MILEQLSTLLLELSSIVVARTTTIPFFVSRRRPHQSTKLKRAMAGQTTNTGNPEDFARHAQEDTALASTQDDAVETPNQGLTMFGKFFIFVIFPLCVGVLGLYMAFLETRRNPDKKLSFDQDFMLPFLLALAMAVVIGFQTGGFTSNKVKPLVAWPKVRRVKKIIRKKKGQAINEEESADKKDN